MNSIADRDASIIRDEDIVRYEEDGAVCFRGVISEAWLGVLRESTELVLSGDLINMSRKGQTDEFVGDVNVWSKDEGFARYAFEGPSWQIAKATRNDKIPNFDANRDSFEFLNWDMLPGDCLVHDSLTVHGSGGNSSLTARRRAIATRWLGERAYFRPTAYYQPKMMGPEPGALLRHRMFPVVPRNGEPIEPRPILK